MRLHLGSGNKRIPNFKNVDIRGNVNVDVVADVRNLHMFPTKSALEMYFCHGMEHLTYDDAAKALSEWRRVLIDGGRLRLSVPDFDKLVQLYRQRGLDKHVRAMICGGMDYEHNIHYSVWTYHVLEHFLTEAGYSGIRRYNPSDFLPDNYFDWSMLEIDGIAISINVEATA